VAPPSQSRAPLNALLRRAAISLAALCVPLLSIAAAHAQDTVEVPAPTFYVADIALQTEEEFVQLLERAEQLMLAGVELPAPDSRVTFVLHGPVLRNLLRKNYLDNKRMVDLAASLSALEVIDVKACRTWMGKHGVDETELYPFVEPVPYGPGLVRELVREREYVYF